MVRTPEQEAARTKLLDTGRYEEYINAAGQKDIRLKGAWQAPAVPATPATQVPSRTPTTTSPTGQVGLRSTAEGLGLNVGWSSETGPTINGVPVSTAGLKLVNNSWQGTQEQIDKLLSPFQQQVPVYQSPYTQQTQEALDNYNAWASRPYVSQYADEIEGMVRDILSRNFEYDPADDEQFQRASKELTRNVMESMNARGILNSTVTENQVQQGVSDLLPQYQQIARQQFMDEGNQLMSQIDMLMGIDESQYGRYQDEGKRLADALGIVMDMDETQYQRWSDAYERRYRESRDKIADEQAAAEAERQKIQDAWERVDNLRYADNEAAIVLGIEPGTLSKEAKIARDEAEQRLKEQKQSLANQLAVINAQYEKERKMSEIRDANSADTQGTQEQVNNYYSLRDIYFGGGNGAYANDPLKAYNWLMSHRQDNVNLIGEKLYNRLVGELEEVMKMQKSYGEKDLTQSQEFTQKNTVYKNALSMRNKITKGGYDSESGEIIPDQPAYSNEEIASYIVYSGLDKPSIEEVLQQTFSIEELRAMGLWED
jgi:hypothetical protein